jgi:hypothetical protein
MLLFKSVRLSFEKLSEFSAMAHQYLEIFMNVTKILFKRFVELFDHNVVPYIPKDGKFKP